ncbi:MAG: hypothetical protein WA441_02370 [Methyloceanibacter sp.]
MSDMKIAVLAGAGRMGQADASFPAYGIKGVRMVKMRRDRLRLAAAVIGLLAFATMPALAEDQSAAAYIRSFYPPDDPNAPEARYTPQTAEAAPGNRSRVGGWRRGLPQDP